MKPVKSQFQCVGHHVPIGSEDIVGKGPGGDLGVGDFLETMLAWSPENPLLPNRRLALCRLCLRNRLGRDDRHTETETSRVS